jgi:hypothetical protein
LGDAAGDALTRANQAPEEKDCSLN